MATPFLTLGSGDTISTPDANILSADYAHMYSSDGTWVDVTDQALAFSGRCARLITTGSNLNLSTSGSAPFQGFGAIAGGETITVSGTWYLVTSPAAARQTRISVREYDAAGADLGFQFGTFAPLTHATETRQSHQYTLKPNTRSIRLYPYYTNGSAGPPDSDEEVHFYDLRVHIGTESDFVPSLDCDTLFEDKQPSTVPATFTKGTGLVVGSSWSGDLESYRRYDGSGTNGLLVAEIDPSDAAGAT